MFYVLKWETTRYYLVGPFAADMPAYEWGEANANPDEPYNGWDVVELDDPDARPEIIAPDQKAPAWPQPLHLTLRPGAVAAGTALAGIPWVGHTGNGTPVLAYFNAILARDLFPGETAAGPYRGQAAVDREMGQMTGVRGRGRATVDG